VTTDQTPIPMRIPCPGCGELHLDEGEFATKPHRDHVCQSCGLTWRPALVPTVGVRFLPGYENEPVALEWMGVLPHSIRVHCDQCPPCAGTNAPGTFGWTFASGLWKCAKHS
jgi:hypothetical protein